MVLRNDFDDDTLARGVHPGQHNELTNAVVALAPNVLSKTANFTAAGSDVVLCDATAGSFTITLPSVTVNGRTVTVKKTDASANTVTISPASGTIDGAASLVISTQWVSYDLVANGTNWYLL